jgi:hypothetical protein
MHRNDAAVLWLVYGAAADAGHPYTAVADPGNLCNSTAVPWSHGTSDW